MMLASSKDRNQASGPSLKELFEKAAELRRNHVPVQDPQTILKNLGGYQSKDPDTKPNR